MASTLEGDAPPPEQIATGYFIDPNAIPLLRPVPADLWSYDRPKDVDRSKDIDR